MCVCVRWVKREERERDERCDEDGIAMWWWWCDGDGIALEDEDYIEAAAAAAVVRYEEGCDGRSEAANRSCTVGA